MSHEQQKEFCRSVKNKFPEFFSGKLVIDIGSLDINGNNQYLFEKSGYIGVDLFSGKNVDIACKGHELGLPDESVDVVISTECFEHDSQYDKTIKNICRILKPGGLFVFSCATTGRPEHGTRKTTPDDAPFVQLLGDWADYYKNLEESDIRAVINVDELFDNYEFSSQHETHDLYFWGFKRGQLTARSDYSFLVENGIVGELRADLAQAVSDIEALKAEALHLKDSLFFVENLHSEVLSSVSWKITKPVRFAGLIMRLEFEEARRSLFAFTKRQLRRLPLCFRSRLMAWRTLLLGAAKLAPGTSTDLSAIQPMTDRRPTFLREQLQAASRKRPNPPAWPMVDVSVVLHNNGRWLDGFTNSVIALDYPRHLLRVVLADNGSTDATPQNMQVALQRLRAEGIDAVAKRQQNIGFGAGHNAALTGGVGEYCFVTNVDLTFTSDALRRVVATALADPKAAAWELRQKPYEHPKYYDPVSWETNWNSHACVLLRREAFDRVGGYDDNLFMYGEDVELSYRLRRAGWLLRYCPNAVVFHYSYQTAGEVKPLQYTGSTFANLYLRLKYGKSREIALVPLMAAGLLLRPEPFPGARRWVFRNMLRLLAKAPAALLARRSSDAVFPFRLWDFEMRRNGAFHPVGELPDGLPLVSVVTRTYNGREALLTQAIASVARQTYNRIEMVVVQDGGDSARPVVEQLSQTMALPVRFVGLSKVGRSAAGNAGLEAAAGRWCLFLDDDDLLFADHVEVLVQALLEDDAAVAAYSPAWEVQTLVAEDKGGALVETAYTVPPALSEPFDSLALADHNLMAIQSVLFERRLWQERGGFDTELDSLEDWVLWNVYAYGRRFKFVPKLTSLFRTPADPTLRQRRSVVLDEARATAQACSRERIEALETAMPAIQHARGISTR